jgi:signal peptidase II
VLAAGATFALDQISKAVAIAALGSGGRIEVLGSWFGFRLVRNPGGVFGLFPQAGLVFFALTVGIVVAVVLIGWRSGRFPIPLGMIAGGGLGNLADRMFRGGSPFDGMVIDFIDFRFWPTFNLADAAITLGVAYIALSSLKREEDA